MLLSLALAWRLRSVLELIYVSALFAVVLMPVVQQIMRLRLGRWSLPRPVAVIALVLGTFLILALFLSAGLPPVLRDIQHFARDLPSRIPGLMDKLRRLPMADKFGVDSLAERAQDLASLSAHYIFASAPLWIRRILAIIAALILCIYFMLEGEFAYFYFLSLFPPESRGRLANTLVRAEHRMSKWLLGQGALMLILGATSTAVFAVLHVRYYFLLGVLMGLFNIVPVAGGIFTILLAAGVAALDSWSKMAGVFIFYAIYVQFESAFLTPRIMRTSVDLIGIAVLIALLAGSAVAGVVGVLVAVPTAALVAVLMNEYLVQEDPDAQSKARQAGLPR